MNIYACIINIQVPHEVNDQRAIAKRTSQIMKYGQDVSIQIGPMYNIQNGKWYYSLSHNHCEHHFSGYSKYYFT